MTTRRHGERGSAVTETVLLIPALLVVLLFVVFVGRATSTDNDVTAAARDGARAASRAADAAQADTVARETVADALAGRHVRCAELHVDVDTTGFTRDGNVGVDVRCAIALGDLTGLRVPGSKTLSARAVEVVDRYRGGLP
jgi:Flp pilus assembly protein TadG